MSKIKEEAPVRLVKAEENQKAAQPGETALSRATDQANKTPAQAVQVKRPTNKYAIIAIADRLEKQYLQGVGDLAVAEAVKALRKLAED